MQWLQDLSYEKVLEKYVCSDGSFLWEPPSNMEGDPEIARQDRWDLYVYAARIGFLYLTNRLVGADQSTLYLSAYSCYGKPPMRISEAYTTHMDEIEQTVVPYTRRSIIKLPNLQVDDIVEEGATKPESACLGHYSFNYIPFP